MEVGISERHQRAIEVRDRLAELNGRLVLVESCTAGMVAATFGGLPGISQWLCGSFVTYRTPSKHRWLGIDEQLLSDPLRGPVSREASAALAHAALEQTPEARFSIAITGDLGPGAPSETDGRCFVAAVDRTNQELAEWQVQLTHGAPRSPEDVMARIARQEEATLECVSRLNAWLKDRPVA